MTRNALLDSIAYSIRDYREGEIPRPNRAHVDRWVSQFPLADQEPLLHEMNHLLNNTYFTKENVLQFINSLITHEGLAGNNPCLFWRGVNFLNIQGNGRSQRDMLRLFSDALREHCGFEVAVCASNGGPFLYIDDIIFSGNRVGNDIDNWIRNSAPNQCTLHIVVIAYHLLGQWQLNKRLEKAKAETGKQINIHYWRVSEIENRKKYKNSSDVLWPANLPNEPALNAYLAETHRFPFEPRQQLTPPPQYTHFSSEGGRQLLEQHMAVAGARIRAFSRNPSPVMKPLGYCVFGLGFGSTIVTFRNCPNNCPLAFWWGDPNGQPPLNQWYPLLPRRTYGDILNVFDEL